jgi:hypothetical protein
MSPLPLGRVVVSDFGAGDRPNPPSWATDSGGGPKFTKIVNLGLGAVYGRGFAAMELTTILNRCHGSSSNRIRALLNYLNRWMAQLTWQRLAPLRKLAAMLLKHVDGIANYCETKVRFGVVEAVNGNIRMLINRGRGYKNHRYLLLKAKRMAVMNIEFIAVHSNEKAA